MANQSKQKGFMHNLKVDENHKDFYLILLHIDNSPNYDYFLLSLKMSGCWGLSRKFKNKYKYNWIYIIYLKYKKMHGGFLQDWATQKLRE